MWLGWVVSGPAPPASGCAGPNPFKVPEMAKTLRDPVPPARGRSAVPVRQGQHRSLLPRGRHRAESRPVKLLGG
ncbi:MAG: hypothetical protein CM15mP77_1750 [Synechococcus sp.]|nr:MAG: hypothetical protein CM15mP77_1750 [Synechococcus sp.]